MPRVFLLFERILFISFLAGCSILRESSTSTPPTPTEVLPAPIFPSSSAVPTISAASPDAETIVMDLWNLPDYDPESVSRLEEWVRRLSEATGQPIVLRSDSHSKLDTIEGLKRGEVQIAALENLSYVVSKDWTVPGLKWGFNQNVVPTNSKSIMFVSRSDSGFEPGNSPQVFEQLASKRPCLPEINGKLSLEDFTESIVVPLGYLNIYNVDIAQSVFIKGLADTSISSSLSSAVYRGDCDFAAINAASLDTYLSNYLPIELSDEGVTFQEWEQSMQILYVSPPILPPPVIVFSSRLSTPVHEDLANAILSIPSGIPDWQFEAFDHLTYDEFVDVVLASDLDLMSFYEQQSAARESVKQEGEPTGTTPENVIVIDVMLGAGDPLLPGYPGGHVDRLVLQAVYAELARLDAEGNYFPYLAAELPSLENGLVRFVGSGEDEQLEVEFPLRPGATWQDGQPLTAEDLVFSWEYVMQPGWPGSRWGNIARPAEIYVAEVQALSPERVLYRFMSQRQARQAAQDGGRPGDPALYADLAGQEGPVVPLDFLEAGRNVLPKHLLEGIPVEEIAGSEFARRPVYAGAYRLLEGGGDGRPIVLEAFEGFFLGKPTIQRVVFGASYAWPQAEPYFQTPEDLAEALRAGAVQAQLGLPAVRTRDKGIPPQAYDALAREGLANVTWAPQNSWETLDFNLDNPHLADRRVRQAITQAIDRRAIVDLALGGHGELMDSYLPSWNPFYAGEQALPDYPYDPETSRRLLEEAGYDLSQFPAAHPQRGPLALKLASMDVTSYPRQGTAELIREQLAAIGVRVEVQFYEWLEFEGQDCRAIRNGRQFDLGMAGWRSTALYDTWYVEHVTASGNIPTPENGCPFEKANWSGWRNARADELIPLLKDGRLALEQPERYRQMWDEHQVLWASELPSLPLFNSQRPVTVVPGLIGVQPSPLYARGVEDTWNIYAWEINE